MEHDEVIARLQKMIEKATQKGQAKKVQALIFAQECVRLEKKWNRYGDCNTCNKQARCEMAPEWGRTVRRNCPHYEGKDETEPCRGVWA